MTTLGNYKSNLPIILFPLNLIHTSTYAIPRPDVDRCHKLHTDGVVQAIRSMLSTTDSSPDTLNFIRLCSGINAPEASPVDVLLFAAALR